MTVKNPCIQKYVKRKAKASLLKIILFIYFFDLVYFYSLKQHINLLKVNKK